MTKRTIDSFERDEITVRLVEADLSDGSCVYSIAVGNSEDIGRLPEPAELNMIGRNMAEQVFDLMRVASI